jgi:hypothetical protein
MIIFTIFFINTTFLFTIVNVNTDSAKFSAIFKNITVRRFYGYDKIYPYVFLGREVRLVGQGGMVNL